MLRNTLPLAPAEQIEPIEPKLNAIKSAINQLDERNQRVLYTWLDKKLGEDAPRQGAGAPLVRVVEPAPIIAEPETVEAPPAASPASDNGVHISSFGDPVPTAPAAEPRPEPVSVAAPSRAQELYDIWAALKPNSARRVLSWVDDGCPTPYPRIDDVVSIAEATAELREAISHTTDDATVAEFLRLARLQVAA